MDIAPIFGVIITTPSHPPPTLVFWRTPPVGSYKINTDGCVKDGFASGGGIIRDSSGQCIRAFFSFYGDCTILEAELRAILDGIILAQRLGLSVLWVESDSTLAIHCITKGGGPWHIQATIRHIRHLLALDRDTITHIYREGNQVADLLASEGWDRRCYHEYSSQDLPRRHRSLVQIDRLDSLLLEAYSLLLDICMGGSISLFIAFCFAFAFHSIVLGGQVLCPPPLYSYELYIYGWGFLNPPVLP
ncbi:Uncharacterized protein Adt_21957 [Abeliophyllum distichum]|uniref:RNase H type-1 domain-containing protein n=1 Tax=Abeliophyllum distichum TaxID=126358 RepID=A0ABD1T123_9LAMI